MILKHPGGGSLSTVNMDLVGCPHFSAAQAPSQARLFPWLALNPVCNSTLTMASSANPNPLLYRLTSVSRSAVALGLSSVNISLPVLLLTAVILAQGDRSLLAQTPFEDAAPAATRSPENQQAFEKRMERIRQELKRAQDEAIEASSQPGFNPEIRDPSPSNPGSFSNPGLRPSLNSGSEPPARPVPGQGNGQQSGFEEQKFGRYRLGPGDVLFVNVQRFPNLNLQGPINPEGAIVLPLAGAVKVQGLTVADAQERIRMALDRYVIEPNVDLSLLSQRPVRVTITGKVASPGYYPLTNPNISEALRLAGGIQASADLRRVTIRRALNDGRTIQQQLDLYSPLVTGANPPKLRLEDGDIIEVPQLTVANTQDYDRSFVSSSTLASQQPVQVTVVGEVSRPGFYVLQTGRVAEALLVAGGSLNSADLRAVEVRRTLSNGALASENVDLYSPLAEGTPLPNLRLEEGNVVAVPKLMDVDVANYNRNLIAKSTLAKPNIRVRLLSYAAGGATTLSLPSGSTFRDAINGIPLNTANLRTMALVRYDPDTGQAINQEINGKDALLGNPNSDLPLQDNDVVVIGRSTIAKISFALNTFTQPFRDVLGFLLFFDSISDSASNIFRPGSSSSSSRSR